MTTATFNDRASSIAAIRTALKARSGKTWSVTGGTGTAYGWIKIRAQPSQCTWSHRETAARDSFGYPVYEPFDTGKPTGQMSPAQCAELGQLLGLAPVHMQGVSIPAGNDYRREYIDRAEGRSPSTVGVPYWD